MMAKSKIDGKELLEGEEAAEVAAAMKVDPAVGQVLPTLNGLPCATGETVGRDLVTPIRVLVGPRRVWMEIVRLEKSELAPGKRDGLKAPGETLYLCRPQNQPAGGPGTYLADELVLLDKPEQVTLAPEPDVQAGGIHVSAKAAKVAEAHGIDLAGVEGTGKDGQITTGDVRTVQAEGPTVAPAPEATAQTDVRTPLHASPSAVKLAKEHGIELESLAGTGKNGQITAADVKNAVPEDEPEATDVQP